jgi:integrase
MSGKRGQSEGSIHKCEDGRWAAVVSLGYVNGKRKRKYVYGQTRGEVREQLKKLLRDQQQGIPISTDRQTVSQILPRWLEERKKIRENTSESYAKMLRLYILPHLGHIQLSKLSPQDVQSFINRLLEAASLRVPLNTVTLSYERH